MEYNVIIVDDDEFCLFMHKTIVELAKFHLLPVTFNSAKKALEYLDAYTYKHIPLIIFLDINMPEINGWEFLDIIHEEPSEIPIYVVVVSSSVDELDKRKAASYAKVIEFSEKPFSEKVFQELKGALPWLGDNV